jgi:molecular chaperone HscB
MRDFFEIFSIPKTYNINLRNLETKFLELQKLYHPDKTSLNPESVMLSSLINQAYETLQNNLMRAIYLVNTWYNFDILSEQTIIDNELMEQILQLQTELFQVQGNKQLTQNFKVKIQTKIESIEKELEKMLATYEISTKQFAIKKVIELKFYCSMLSKVD